MREKKYPQAYILFLLAVALFAYSPFTALPSMYGMVGDTAIQIKLGLDGISGGHMILDEIYSWHDGLTFTSHESGWYLLLGASYKLLGIMGVILVGTLFIYGTMALITKYNVSRKVNPLIAAAIFVAVPYMNGFPDYNIRPATSSTFIMILLVSVFFSNMKQITKGIIFASCCLLLAWLHGGLLPIFAAIMLVFVVMELVFKHPRESLIYLASLAAGFVVSLLNPIGICVWTFGLKQQSATDIWQYVGEWKPHVFTILPIVLILLMFIGFMVDPRIKKFDKDTLTKLALLCMFFVATCVYTRFIMQFTCLFLMFAPEEYQYLLSWLNENLFKVKKPIEFSESFYKILSLACVALVVVSGTIDVPKYFMTNSMADIENMAAYDSGVVDYIKANKYERVFNSFNTGSWLAFNDVKVHIDNRIDPYMAEYSGVDHIRGKMGIYSLRELDDFCNEYDCDAVVLDMDTDFSPLLYEIETYAPDRYRVVYDNVAVSNITDAIAIRWVIIEPV